LFDPLIPLEGLFEIDERLHIHPLLAVEAGKVIVREDKGRLQSYGLPELTLSHVVLFLFEADNTEVIVDPGRRGILLGDLLKELLRLLVLPLLGIEGRNLQIFVRLTILFLAGGETRGGPLARRGAGRGTLNLTREAGGR
jgi:hypothetical protein